MINIYAVLTALFWGIQAVCSFQATKVAGEYTAQAAVALFSVFVCIAEFVVFNRFAETEMIKIIPWTLGSVFAGALASIAYYKAFSNYGALTISISSTYPLVSLFLLSLLNYQKFSIQQAIGSVLIVAGVTIISR